MLARQIEIANAKASPGDMHLSFSTQTRLAAVVALAIAMLVGWMAAAEANARVCRQLERQLASAGSGGGQSGRQARAAEQQRRELGKARSIQRRAGCFRMLGLGGSQCDRISVTIERMERNLARLESGSGRSGGSRDRARIQAALRANDCYDQLRSGRQTREARAGRQDEVRRPPSSIPNPGRILDELFGGSPATTGALENRRVERERRAERERAPAFDDDADRRGSPRVRRVENGSIVTPSAPARLGSYRTMCVRTCDGYFFPMSAASSPSDFARDQRGCEAMCPGTEVKLYHHDATGEETDKMLSVTGEPYTALPTAFLYKSDGFRRPPACGCNASRQADGGPGFTVIAGRTPAELADEIAKQQKEAAASVPLPVPLARPDASADPETLANREGGFSPDAMARILAAPRGSDVAEDPGDRRVRVVGPVFLPDQKGAIDLRVPAQTDVQ